MPEDMYMYGMSLSQNLDMEMSNDMEYSNYYLGDNSTGEWWNDTDSWETLKVGLIHGLNLQQELLIIYSSQVMK